MENEKAKKIADVALSQLGNPYVYGAWGSTCTPSMRKKYAGLNSSHAAAIKKACRVLSGKASTCSGCKWDGKLAFDCRGFTFWTLKQVGIVIDGQGATSQYKTASNWQQRGKIADGLPDVIACVFCQNASGSMYHTGLHIGGGQIIHCSNGVQTGTVNGMKVTHYAIPIGLYTPEEIKQAKKVIKMTTIKKGATGAAVDYLQDILCRAGYLGVQDRTGTYDADTVAAVRLLQLNYSLTVDGICGPKTWAVVEIIKPADEPEKPTDAPTMEEILQEIRNTYTDHVALLDRMNSAIARLETKITEEDTDVG